MRRLAANLVQTVAILASIVLVLSFAIYGLQQASGASQSAQTAVNSGAPANAAGAAIHQPPHTAARQAIDDVNDTLVSPFASIAPGDVNAWRHRIVELMLGLLLYGLGLGLLSRAIRLAEHHHHHDSGKTGPPAPPTAGPNPWAGAGF